MEQELLQLEQRLNELVSWQKALMRERFTYPLDDRSIKILQRKQIISTGRIVTDVIGVTLTDLITVGFGISINGRNKIAVAIMPLKPFTAGTNDIITSQVGNHGLVGTDRILLTTTDTLPDGLTDTDVYYPVSITATTFKVSLTENGTPVDIIDTGIGNHYYAKIQ